MVFTVSTDLRLQLVACCTCGVLFGMGEEFDNALRDGKQRWFCPNGHPQSYTGRPVREKLATAEEKIERLVKERDRATDDVARKGRQLRALKKRTREKGK